MEELLELRQHIQEGRYADAIVLIGEMEEMSRDDKINKIGSFLTIVLLHLIKQHAEERSTRSWEVSIRNSVNQIVFTNRRRRAGGTYLVPEEIRQAIEERYEMALRQASLEALEGMRSAEELAEMVDETVVKEEALGLVLEAQAGL